MRIRRLHLRLNWADKPVSIEADIHGSQHTARL